MSSCLQDSEIHRLRAGELDDARADAVRRHLANCTACARRDEALVAKQDELIQQARAAAGQGPAPNTVSSSVLTVDQGEAPASRAHRSVAAPHFEGYEIVHEVSRGGQGIIYQALQKSTKRKVAIKVLLEGPFASRSARHRFEREIELVAQLKHPNIIAIFDSGVTADNQPFYVMDYIRGVPLHHYVRQEKLGLDKGLELFAKVCDAIEYAHQRGVIHRDLKPSNILVDAQGSPRILDFGLAKSLSAPTDTVVSITQQWFGTLPYMSPEQAKGEQDKVDVRTDIYALGVILFELLTGQYPYPVVGQLADVLRNIGETAPTPPTRCWTGEGGIAHRASKRRRTGCPIDDEVETIVLKALQKERERRYQSVGEMAADLRRYLLGEPIMAKRESKWYVLRKYAHRHAKLTVGLAAVVVAIISSSFVATFMYFDARDAQRRMAEIARRATLDALEAEALGKTAIGNLREQALGWFLAEWEGNRLERAESIRDELRETPEGEAASYLLDGVWPTRAGGEATKLPPELKLFAIAERHRRLGERDAAIEGFTELLSRPGGQWIKQAAKARLMGLTKNNSESQASSPFASGGGL